jgi:hypothetical protein
LLSPSRCYCDDHIKEDEIGGVCRTQGTDKKDFFFGKPEWERPLGRYRRSWEDNIKIELKEIGRENDDWIHPLQDRVQWQALVNIRFYKRLGIS